MRECARFLAITVAKITHAVGSIPASFHIAFG
jgi:hypothetical protein